MEEIGDKNLARGEAIKKEDLNQYYKKNKKKNSNKILFCKSLKIKEEQRDKFSDQDFRFINILGGNRNLSSRDRIM